VFRELLVEDVVVNGSFETGDYSGWENGGVGGPYKNGAYHGQYYTSIPANRYAGYLAQTLPVSDCTVLRCAFRFRAPNPEWQVGHVGFVKDTREFYGLYVTAISVLDGRLQVEIAGWKGEMAVTKDADGWWNTGWHTLTAIKKQDNYYDVYLDGSFLTSTSITPTNRLWVDATGLTTSIVTGQFDFDDIIVGV
jgi:hypothetical protein